MFSYFFDTVTGYLGGDFFSSLLWVSLIVSAAALLALMLISLFLQKQDDRSRSIEKVLAITLTLSKVFGGVLLTTLLVISLKWRYEDFNHLYGRVTESNYSAVESIWGSPHDQRNLQVRHYVEEEEIIEQLKSGDQDMALEGIPAEVERRFRKKVTREVIQDSIIKNDHRVTITMNYRKKGSAYYTTYEDEAEFNYAVKNRSDKTTTARFTFPLPLSQGMVHELKIFVDGADYGDKINVSGQDVSWSMAMAPGQENNLKVSYQSRGMEYWAFRMDSGMEALNNFRLQVVIPGYDVENNPIGCMSPTNVVHDGQGTVLEWKLDRAVTSLGMGVVLPRRPQPGHYESALLKSAPEALFILAAMIVITRLLLGARMGLLPVMLIVFASERFFAIIAYFRALEVHISVSMLLSATLLIGSVAVFLLQYGDKKTIAGFQTVIFALLTVGYSLCVIETDHTPFLLQILYVILLLAVMVMAVIHHRPSAVPSADGK